MKKLLTILLIAVMLVSAFSFTAFADSGHFDISPKSSIDYDALLNYNGLSFNVDWFGYTKANAFISGSKIDVYVFYDGRISIRFWINETNNNNATQYQTDGTLKNSSFNLLTIDSSTADSMTLNFLGHFFDIILPECDGSACPIKDVNLDEICDECGNAVTMSMRASSAVEGTHFVVNGIAFPLEYRTSSLEGSLKDIMQRRYDEDVNWYAFITVTEAGVYHLRITNAPFVANRNTGMLYIPDSVTETEWTSMQYRLSGDYWAYNGDFTIEKGDSFPLSTVYATSNTFFFDDLTVYMQGENFFQLTPRVEIGQAVTIQEAGVQIRQVMMIVGIVAVSCLALWISFLILLKVLRNYLKK